MLVAGIAPPGQAQITPDTSLGRESSQVSPGTVQGSPAALVQGGALRGANLFHSFLNFNVGQGERVYFANPSGIRNILGRVTGADPSQILGTLGVTGAANLFLINPHGILFGPQARLDISGSFTASTADRFLWSTGAEFSATNPQAAPLLQVNLQPGLQYGATSQATITNQGQLRVGQDLTLAAANLNLQGQLQAGGNLLLRATDRLTIRDSTSEPFIASAGANLQVQGDRLVDIFALNHPSSGLFAGRDLVLRSAGTVGGDAHYTSGGNFRIERLDGGLGNLYSPHDPIIRTAGDVFFNSYEGASLHIQAGGQVFIPGYIWIQGPDPTFGLVENVTLVDGSTIPINGRLRPTLDIRAGTLAVNPAGVGGTGILNPIPGVAVLQPAATGADITVGTIFFADPTVVNPNTGLPTALAGDVLLTNQYLPNPNLGGNIRMVATADPNGVLANRAIVNGTAFAGGFVDVHSRGAIGLTGIVNTDAGLGVGGDVTLRANGDITLTPGSLINSTGVLGGNVTLTSGGTVSVSGPTLPGLDITGVASFSTGPAPGQKGGDIRIRANSLFLNNNAFLISSTSGQANAGNISIQTDNLLSLSNHSQIRGLVERGGNGRAADIDIQTGSLSITGGSQILSALFRELRDPNGTLLQAGGQGEGGNITIQAADRVLISGYDAQGFSSGILTLTERGALGPAGNITLTAGQLQLEQGAGIAANSRNPGQGGGLQIKAGSVDVRSGARILANSDSTGAGGLIDITADRLTIAGSDPNFNTRLQLIDQYLASPAGQGDTREDIFGGVVLRNSGLFANTAGFAPAGNIRLQSSQITVADSGVVLADTFGAADGGNIFLKSQNLTLTSGGEILTRTFGSGSGGVLSVEPLDPNRPSTVTIAGVAPFTGLILAPDGSLTPDGGYSSGLLATTENGGTQTNPSNGPGGIILLTATNLNLSDGGVISARTRSAGRAGEDRGILLDVTNLTMTNGGQILAPTFNQGQAGDILAIATGNVTISGSDATWFTRREQIQQAFEAAGFSPAAALRQAEFTVDPVSPASGFQATVQPGAQANGGNLLLTAGTLTMDNSEIGVSTSGRGNAGNIGILVNGPINLTASTIRSAIEPGGQGDGGNILVQGQSLTMTGGAQLLAGVFRPLNGEAGGIGQGGTIQVYTSDFVSLSGTNPDGFRSGLFASTEQGAIGDGGAILVATNDLTIRDRAVITAQTRNASRAGDILLLVGGRLTIANQGLVSVDGQSTGNPGNIFINATGLVMSQAGSISATSASGNNANIVLRTPGGIYLQPRDVLISAEAANNGSGGNITIFSPIVLTSLLDNNDVIANADLGPGGNIRINGIDTFDGTGISGNNGDNGPARVFRRGKTPDPQFSDLTASSALGVDGTVQVQNTILQTNPTLPAGLVDRSSQVSQACKPGSRQTGSSFTVTGRGGIPAAPSEPLGGEEALAGWVTATRPRTEPAQSRQTSQTSPTPIAEAQGWQIRANGEIVLVAQAAQPTPQTSGFPTPRCSISPP